MACAVCLEAFDREVQRPKLLPCGHTFCLQCLRNPAINNLCPQDRQAFEGHPVTLPDNFALLQVIAEPTTRAEGVWCEFCRRQFSGDCADAGHRPCSERQRRAAAQAGADVAELRREVEELRLQMNLQELQRKSAQPAARLELDVEEYCKNQGFRKERNDLLLGDQLTQVRKLTGLDCSVDVAWAEAVLIKVAPHVEELDVDNAKLQHLRAIQGMASLTILHLMCCDLDANADVPLLPLQLEKLTLMEFRKGHLLSLQWMPKLRDLYLIGCEAKVPLAFTAMPDHCGIREMTLGFFPTETLLSLVRAHAATLQVLRVNIASSDAYCNFRPKFSSQLHECGLVALKELLLYRNEAQHDKVTCRGQMVAFVLRFGPNVAVRCSECRRQ